MPTIIKMWKCNYCHKKSTRKGTITFHEGICYKNKNRRVLEGELALWRTFPRAAMVDDSYGVLMSDFQHPCEDIRDVAPWWPSDEHGCPGLGYIFLNGEWHKIKGYKEPCFAPGYSWRDEIIPRWLDSISSPGHCRDTNKAIDILLKYNDPESDCDIDLF